MQLSCPLRILGFFWGVLLIGAVWITPVWALPTTQQIAKLEQQLFSRTYDGDILSHRLDRIESTIYGEVQTNRSETERWEAVEQFIKHPRPAASTVGQTAQAPPQAIYGSRPPETAAKPPDPVASSSSTQPNADPEESSYPTVQAMEQRVLGQTYNRDALETRLSRLETKVLGAPQPGSLQDRSDFLSERILGRNPNGPPAQETTSTAYSPSPTTGGAPGQTVATADLLQALPQVERQVLRQTFAQDTLESRLGRLEMAVFNATSPEMTPEDRLYRIVSVVSAQRSSQQETSAMGRSGWQWGSSRTSGGYASPYGYGNTPYGSYPPPYGTPSRGSTAGTLGSLLLMILMSML